MSDEQGKSGVGKAGSLGQENNAVDSDQQSGRVSWDKRGQKTAAGLSDELASAAEDMSPDELRRLRR